MNRKIHIGDADADLLAAYKATGMTPEEIVQMQAMAEGIFLKYGRLYELAKKEEVGYFMELQVRYGENIGAKIRKARKEAGLTQTELGNLMGAKFTQVSEWELGKRNPRPETIRRIEEALKKVEEQKRGGHELRLSE